MGPVTEKQILQLVNNGKSKISKGHDGLDKKMCLVTQIASHVGPTSAEDRHWSAISADMADTGPTSAEDRH